MTQHDRFEARSLADVTPEQMTRYSEGTFTDLIGLKYTEVGPDRVVGEWVVSPQLHQPAGIVNGGVYCTIIETLASVGGGVWFGDRGHVVGVNNNTDFLRAVREGSLRGVATPIHQGRSQQLWQVQITDEQDRVVARGQVRLQNLTADGAAKG
ncbi:PaaI family thioesterase [Nocardia mikamii]|uniref:PaaI family thioesterase n=1 Tax=Nocardia mikamii TaxID=508464 RepID=UPI000B27F132